MKAVKQTKFGNPEGNCLAACIASLLECDLDEVPNQATAKRDGKHWFDLYNDFLRDRGLGLVLVDTPVPVCVPKDCYYIASGQSARGLMHSVIHLNGELVHDPHPDGTGIRAIEDYLFIVRLN